MDPAARLRTWTPRILFLAVSVVLVLVGVIQYQWFSRSASVEIEATVRGLESGVRQTVAREFQRYAPLVADLTASTSSDLSAAQARDLLARVWSVYGAGGTAPDLVAWVGWGRDNEATMLRRGEDGWTRGPRPTLPPPAESSGAPRLTWSLDSGKGSQATLAVDSGRQVIYLGLDGDRFFSAYIRPALIEGFPGASVAWEKAGPRFPPPPGGFDPHTYAFNPLTALGRGPSLPPTLSVGVPRFFDARGFRAASPDGSPPFPELPSGGFATLKLTLPADTPVFGVERRLAWNWLGSSLLLVVLGAAFGLVLRQAGRLADLRRREREFVASVSHELRTPLTVIRSAADNFARGIVAPDRQGRYGQLILDQSLRLGRMIEEMLSFAQAEAASAPPVLAPLVFARWLGELRPGLEALASARSVALSWDVAGVPAEGLGDPDALRLILENLVVNAVNHAYPPVPQEGGPRTVRITLRHLVPDRLELIVDDDGRGISPKEAKKVFEPFYRDQVGRNSQEKGSGLGLFLALRQARRLGGELRLESPWRRLDGSRRSGCRFALIVPFHLAGPEIPHGR